MCSGFIWTTLYVLSLGCCTLVDSGVRHARDQYPQGGIYDDQEAEVRYQRQLDRWEDQPGGAASALQHLGRRTLVESEPYPRAAAGGGQQHAPPSPLSDHLPLHTDLSGSNLKYAGQEDTLDLGEDILEDSEDDEDILAESDESPHRTGGARSTSKSRMLRTNKNASRKLPQAVIIGVKKAGTRALLEFLRVHPDVRAPGPEPHFFDRYFHKGLDWYR